MAELELRVALAVFKTLSANTVFRDGEEIGSALTLAGKDRWNILFASKEGSQRQIAAGMTQQSYQEESDFMDRTAIIEATDETGYGSIFSCSIPSNTTIRETLAYYEGVAIPRAIHFPRSNALNRELNSKICGPRIERPIGEMIGRLSNGFHAIRVWPLPKSVQFKYVRGVQDCVVVSNITEDDYGVSKMEIVSATSMGFSDNPATEQFLYYQTLMHLGMKLNEQQLTGLSNDLASRAG
jgi:hypothetical protein